MVLPRGVHIRFIADTESEPLRATSDNFKDDLRAFTIQPPSPSTTAGILADHESVTSFLLTLADQCHVHRSGGHEYILILVVLREAICSRRHLESIILLSDERVELCLEHLRLFLKLLNLHRSTFLDILNAIFDGMTVEILSLHLFLASVA